MPDLSSYRVKFSSLNNCHHLISNSLGAVPDRALEYAQDYIETWSRLGVRAWREWWPLSRQVGDQVGAIIGAAPDTVTMLPNVTSASAVVQSCFDLDAPRNKIVMVDMEFPSILYVYREWARDRGRVELIASADGVTISTEEILDAIDETTLLVPISHVFFRSSYIIEIEKIIEKAHSVGAYVVLDAFQSVGTVPIDVEKLNVDFLLGGCLKWLCGGPGACFLYVRPDLINKLNPRFTGWMAHDNPFAFKTGPIERAEGSYRFMNGTPVIPALYTCRAGLEIITEIGVDNIRKRSKEMTARLIELADERNWKATTPRDPERRAGTVALDIPNAEAVSEELLARDFLVDYRPKAGIRIAPHFYNTDQEIEDVISEIDDIIANEAYRKHFTDTVKAK